MNLNCSFFEDSEKFIEITGQIWNISIDDCLSAFANSKNVAFSVWKMYSSKIDGESLSGHCQCTSMDGKLFRNFSFGETGRPELEPLPLTDVPTSFQVLILTASVVALLVVAVGLGCKIVSNNQRPTYAVKSKGGDAITLDPEKG